MILVNDILTTYLVEHLKLGRHSSVLAVDDPIELTLALSSRATVTITAIVWTKTAFAVTLLRLTSGTMKAFVWFVILSTNIAMGLGAMVPWIQCVPLAKGWNRTLEGSCWGPDDAINIWIATGGTSSMFSQGRVSNKPLVPDALRGWGEENDLSLSLTRLSQPTLRPWISPSPPYLGLSFLAFN